MGHVGKVTMNRWC